MGLTLPNLRYLSSGGVTIKKPKIKRWKLKTWRNEPNMEKEEEKFHPIFHSWMIESITRTNPLRNGGVSVKGSTTVWCSTQAWDLLIFNGELVIIRDFLVDPNGLL